MPIRTDLRRPSRTITVPARRFHRAEFGWELPTFVSIVEGVIALVSLIILAAGCLTLCALGAMVMPFIARLVWFTLGSTPQMVTRASEASPESWFWFIVTAFMLFSWGVLLNAAENEGQADEPIRGRTVLPRTEPRARPSSSRTWTKPEQPARPSSRSSPPRPAMPPSRARAQQILDARRERMSRLRRHS